MMTLKNNNPKFSKIKANQINCINNSLTINLNRKHLKAFNHHQIHRDISQ